MVGLALGIIIILYIVHLVLQLASGPHLAARTIHESAFETEKQRLDREQEELHEKFLKEVGMTREKWEYLESLPDEENE